MGEALEPSPQGQEGEGTERPDDQARSYGRQEDGEQVTVDSLTGQVTALTAGTMLPQGIGAGGYGVFRTDTAVVVLPPR